MDFIHRAIEDWSAELALVRIPVDRLTLAKRRWRGVAEDGRDFGFDLEKPLSDGAAILATDSVLYLIAQRYEPVLEVRSAEFGMRSADAARLGWMIGNLHFQIEVVGEIVRVIDDPAVRQMFEREGIPYTACRRIFHPLSGGHQH